MFGGKNDQNLQHCVKKLSLNINILFIELLRIYKTTCNRAEVRENHTLAGVILLNYVILEIYFLKKAELKLKRSCRASA